MDGVDSVESFSGKVVLVTGGTRGLGRVLAQKFATRGAAVITCARRPPDEPDAADHESSVAFIPCDVRDADQVHSVIDQIVERHGRLDVLINNAGGSPAAAAADSSPSFIEKIVALNLLGPITFAQAAYRVMSNQDSGGSIINISSISGMRANPMGVAYGAAKAGLLNATQTLAVEWGPTVRVNAVSAGPMLTDGAIDNFAPSDIDRLASALPAGRLGDPGEIAEAVLFIASDRSGFMTGANLVVDGGPEWPQAGYPQPERNNT